MRTIVFTLALLISISGYAQDKKGCLDFIKKYDTMKDFDIKRFEDNKVWDFGCYRYPYTKDDGTQIEQYEDKDGYSEIITPPNSAIQIRRSYYKTGEPKGFSKMFYSTYWGIQREYDKQGNIINTRDIFPTFRFKIEDLIEKIKHDYGIDLLIRQDGVVVDVQAIDPPFYRVTLSRSKKKALLIDGLTGKVIEETDEKGKFGAPRPIEETAELVKENRTEKDFILKKQEQPTAKDSIILESSTSKPKRSWIDRLFG